MVHRIWLALALCLALAFDAALAQPYGAIAYDERARAWGLAYDHASQQAADRRGVDECRRRASACEIVVRFWGQTCAAYATGAGSAAAYGSGSTRLIAEQNAVAVCRRHGQGCEPRVWSCNTRSGGNEAFTPTEMCHFWDSAEQRYVTRFCSSR
jgi:hypothetical protein